MKIHQGFLTVYSIKNLIKELEATGKWAFTYMGATIDAIEIAVNMNIKVQNSMSFEKESFGETYAMLANSLERYIDLKSTGEKTGYFLIENNP